MASSQTGHKRPMIRPLVSTKFDYEGELVVIIGKQGRYIPLADTTKHIAGYSIYNEGSIRDWQNHTSQFGPGKNFPQTGGFGPWLVTTDEIPDPSQLARAFRLQIDRGVDRFVDDGEAHGNDERLPARARGREPCDPGRPNHFDRP